ncbi:MAG: hypothetical protein DRH70_06005 [Candidatus Coatesbacteria bacterium]|nr:MAG: hypothetical protein DRH70_06005 [Candidatus Coatesbacteria bacterium]
MLAAATLASISTASVGTISTSATAASSMATLSTAASLVHKAAAATPTPPPGPVSFWHSMGFSAAGGQVMELFKSGGPFMWPILFASFIGVMFLVDRLVSLSREARATNKMLKSLNSLASEPDVDAGRLEATCRQFERSPIATMTVAGLEKIEVGEIRNIESAIERAGQAEMGRLEKGLPALASVSNIAPLIGFLGTVWGIILAFHVIGLKKVVNPQDISEGISQALIMSAAGLSVAIPVAGAYNYFTTRVGRIAVMMHEGAYILTVLFSMMVGDLAEPGKVPAAEESERPAAKGGDE